MKRSNAGRKARPRANPSFDIDSVTPLDLRKLVDKAGGQRAFCRKHAIPRATLQLRLHKLVRDPFHHQPPPRPRLEDVNTGLRRFILTSAQDGTRLHDAFLDNLLAYRDHRAAEGPCDLMVAGYTYNKRLYEDHSKNKSKAPIFPERVRPFLVDERIRLGDRIDFCGEMNTLPTAETPLSSFETYTRERWGVFPHAKVQLRSIPTMKNSPAKIIMTTGSVTRPNYVQKRAGIKASFNHTIGAVLVEIASDGTFFARHLLAEEDGSFYDLDTRVATNMVDDGSGGRVNKPLITSAHPIEAINWGDLHVAQIDPVVARTCFGFYPTSIKVASRRYWNDVLESDPTPILDALKPKYQFFHDVSDFQARNHHNVRDPHHMYALYVNGVDSVEEELREVAMFIERTTRPFCETVIVESNHDLALKRWLREADYRHDPMNAEFFLECQRQTYRAIREGRRGFSIFEHVLTAHFDDYRCKGVRFLREDESFTVLGIEKGMHGHLGANGARGSPRAFTKMGPKATTGHTHSCEIRDGIYTSGTSSKLDMGYNKGLSSWSHSHVITLPNGKRQIITIQNGRWRL